MEKEKLIKGEDVFTTEQFKKITIYYQVKRMMNQFSYKCTMQTFKNLFQESGERLWNHYTVDCHRSFEKFETYLTQEQINTFYLNAVLNPAIHE